MRTFISVSTALLISSLALAASDPFAVEIKPPGEVQLIGYENCSKTFEIELKGEEGADYFYVSPEEVLNSLSGVSAKALKESPKSLLNKTFKLKKSILFHPTPFIEARRKDSKTCKK
ncbi:hypothetical protein GW916_12400 [bacterium]|nr:hypothetical protein [bacterium]